jgi:hypothetical protein
LLHGNRERKSKKMKMAKNNKRKEVYEVDEGDHQTVEEKKLW